MQVPLFKHGLGEQGLEEKFGIGKILFATHALL